MVNGISNMRYNTRTPNNIGTAEQMVNNAITSAIHSLRCLVSTTTKCSPGVVIFGRVMLVDIPLITNLYSIQQKRQLSVNENLRRQNEQSYEYHYRVGDYLDIKAEYQKKLDEYFHGPFQIISTNLNGTVTLQLLPNVKETIHCRKIQPVR